MTKQRDEKGEKNCAAVLGFGRAGRAATDFLLREGLSVAVYDEKPVERSVAAPYRARGVRFMPRGFPAFFKEPLLVRSPGLRPDLSPILASLERGATLTDETALFLSHTKARVIGVTGSDGKSTTSALIAAMLSAAGERVFLGGNNGVPLLPRVGEMREGDAAVLELSSFQLMTAQLAPDVAVITNITPNHLDWHKSMAEYVGAKRRLSCGARRAVCNATYAALSGFHPITSPPTVFFSLREDAPWGMRPCDALVFPVGENEVAVKDGAGVTRFPVFEKFPLPGAHNKENLMAAIGALWGRVSPEVMTRAAAEFKGVRHRLQYIDTVAGVRYIDSSIDTTPTRTAAALGALAGARPLVIAGGRGKGISLRPLGDALARHARAVFAYGETREEIAAALDARLPYFGFETFTDAFHAAAKAAREGDTVLLSPGCTAFGEFRDFEERGEVFCDLVRTLSRERNEKT